MEEKAENKQLKINAELCYHCGLPVRKGFKANINDEPKAFCCNGCKTACELIYSVNAGSYYKNRLGFSEVPVKNISKIYPYDSELFRKQYLKEKDGLQTIIFHLDNLHCPSCIWVIEKVLGNITAIKDINVNFTSHRANISFDESKVSLEYIINTLVKIGYPPVPVEKTELEKRIVRNNRTFLLRMVIAVFGMMSTMFLAEPTYGGYVQDLDPVSAGVLQYLALIISTPVFFYTITPYYRGLAAGLRYGIFTMDLTIFTGATLIYLYSAWATMNNRSPVYFDCLTMFLFLITLGRFIESSIQEKIFHNAERNLRYYPYQATVIRNNQEILIHTDEIKIGERILVRPGEKIPVDGLIMDGASHIDESVISGESKAVAKKTGDVVLGGSINLEGAFCFKATKTSSDSTLSQITILAENINSKRSLRQTTADKAANIFISFVLLLALTVFIYYIRQNPAVAVIRSMAILVASCPCALGLAMPTAISISGFAGIKKGILFKKPETFEILTKINHIVFDKTGTLTLGKMTLNLVKSFSDYTENDLLEIAAAIERYSEHPIAWSIVAEAKMRNLNTRKAQDFKAFPGKGVRGSLDNKVFFIGNLAFLNENGIDINDLREIEDICESRLFIAGAGKILGYFVLSERLKDNVYETIKMLQSKNIEITLLSGDKKSPAEKVGKQLGIKNVISEVLPWQKAEYISGLKKQGYQVAMAGDGINDAPAMSEADIGIALCPNNDFANINSNVVILNSDFSSLMETFELAGKTVRIINQNLIISFIYNLIVIPFAVTGYITPLWAAVLMPFSSIIVLLNSIRAGK